jgi:streptomycin 6-kinase
VRIPESLRDGVISWNADGQDWADSLPALVAHSCERWGLEVGDPYEGGYTAWVAPAEGADGSSYVLKVPYPDTESRPEPEGLRIWDGDGVVCLLDWDEATRALLLERIRPGTSLLGVADPDEALAVACSLLPRLWIAPPGDHPFLTAQACAASWAVDVERMYGAHGEPFDAALLRAAVTAFEQLAGYDGEAVMLHQDFHRGNVLRAEREPWLAIDPKPLVGERAFDARWLMYDLLHAAPRHSLPAEALLERLSAELALDPERVRLWSFARAVENVLWCCESGEAADEDLALATALL